MEVVRHRLEIRRRWVRFYTRTREFLEHDTYCIARVNKALSIPTWTGKFLDWHNSKSFQPKYIKVSVYGNIVTVTIQQVVGLRSMLWLQKRRFATKPNQWCYNFWISIRLHKTWFLFSPQSCAFFFISCSWLQSVAIANSWQCSQQGH